MASQLLLGANKTTDHGGAGHVFKFGTVGIIENRRNFGIALRVAAFESARKYKDVSDIRQQPDARSQQWLAHMPPPNMRRFLAAFSRIRLSDTEPRFVCAACGSRGAAVRPDFNWGYDGASSWLLVEAYSSMIRNAEREGLGFGASRSSSAVVIALMID
jgi:hypothetical protein